MMGMETQPELSNQSKGLDFVDRISLGYVDQVDLGFFKSDFQFFRFGRDFVIPKHSQLS